VKASSPPLLTGGRAMIAVGQGAQVAREVGQGDGLRYRVAGVVARDTAASAGQPDPDGGRRLDLSRNRLEPCVVQPQPVKNLSVTVDYFHIAIDQAIGTIGAPNILQGCYVNGNDDYCKLIVRNNFGAIQYINDLNQNIGQRSTAGIDFAVRYALPTPAGRFGASFDGNWLAFYDSTLKLATGDQTIHGKGNYDLGALPAFKANVGVDWGLDRLIAGVIARYVGNFRECSNPSDPTTAAGGLCALDNTHTNPYERQAGHYVQVDVPAAFTLGRNLGTTAFSPGISNLFSKAPRYIYSANRSSL